MFFEWIGEERRQPIASGERTTCRLCGGQLTGVISLERQPHWRHMSSKDCDAWGESEGPWHLAWKERFPMETREVPLVDAETGERHRADVFLSSGGGSNRGVTLELQHSPISDDMVRLRESFYGARGQMVWLVHLHDDGAFHGKTFRFGLNGRRAHVDKQGRTYYAGRWYSGSTAFIGKWKASQAHVIFDCEGSLYYLATMSGHTPWAMSMAKNEFAVRPISQDEFIAGLNSYAVRSARHKAT